MQEQHQIIKEAFDRVWSLIYNPKSMCPDVEVGRVQEVLAQVLGEYTYLGLQGVDKWVMSTLTLTPSNIEGLTLKWDDSKGSPLEGQSRAELLPIIDDPNYKISYLDYCLHLESAQEIRESLDRLLAASLVKMSDGKYWAQ